MLLGMQKLVTYDLMQWSDSLNIYTQAAFKALIFDSTSVMSSAVPQWIRTFAPQAESWVFESQPRQTLVVKTGSDSSTTKRPVSVMGPRRSPLKTAAPCHSRCGTLKNPHCSMAISFEHRSKFATFTGNGDVSK